MVLSKGLAGKLLVAGALWMALGSTAQAQKMEIVFKDTLWGIALGALIGAVQVAQFEEPENETHRIGQGATIGAVVGLVYGFLDASGVFGSAATYDVDRNRLVVGMPALWYSRHGRERRLNASLLEVRF